MAGYNAQQPPPLLHHLITQQVVHARPSGNHQWESAQPAITTEASSKRPTTDSKDHDRRLTIVSPYARYFDVAAGHEAPQWMGWTSLDGCASQLRLLLVGFEYRQTNMKYLGKIDSVIVTR